MRQLLAGILLLSSLAVSQQVTAVATKGDLFTGVTPVYWGATNSIVLTPSSTDTASAWACIQPTGSKPGTSVTVAYRAKATDGATSVVSFLIDSRYCRDPINAVGCDSLPTLNGQHYIYGSSKIVDTLPIVNPSTVAQYTSEFYIPHANSVRLVIHVGSIAGGQTVRLSGVQLLGQ